MVPGAASYCTSETCRRALLLAHFGERLPRGGCTGCDVCRDPAAVALQVRCPAPAPASRCARFVEGLALAGGVWGRCIGR